MKKDGKYRVKLMTPNSIWLFMASPRNLALIVALATGIGFLIKEVAIPLMQKGDVLVEQQATSKTPTQSTNSPNSANVVGNGNTINISSDR